MSRRGAIETVVTRLSAIRKIDGFNTDVGLAVLVGEEPVFGPSDPTEVVSVTVGEDEVRHQGENVVTVVPIEIIAIVKADVATPLVALEKVIEDIKRAVELEDRTLGGNLVQQGFARGLTRPYPREPGSEYVAVGVQYRGMVAEGWGSP